MLLLISEKVLPRLACIVFLFGLLAVVGEEASTDNADLWKSSATSQTQEYILLPPPVASTGATEVMSSEVRGDLFPPPKISARTEPARPIAPAGSSTNFFTPDLTSKFLEFVTLFVPASEKIQNEVCRKHSQLFLQELQNFTFWAVEMFDSSAKIPDGMLQGNIRHLGNFDGCVDMSVNMENRQLPSFQGQYCMASAILQTTPSTRKENFDLILNAMTSKRRHLEVPRNLTNPGLLPVFSLFEWAFCIPSSCTAEDLKVTLDDAISRTLLPLGIKADIEVKQEQCYVKAPRKYTEKEYIMLGFTAFMLVLIVASTTYDVVLSSRVNQNHGTATKAILAFSLPANWKRLGTSNGGSGTLDCIDGIRALSTLWVIMTHKVLSLSQEPWINKVYLAQAARDFLKMPLQNSMLNVDSFFLISGLLKAYHFVKEVDQNKQGFFTMYAQRYLRLTPAYGIMIFFYTTFFVYMGSGPAWSRTVQNNADRCVDNWFLNILYINNYINYDRMCMLQSWYLAADMQLCILAPFILYPLWKWRKLGIILLSTLVMSSIISPFIMTYVYKYPAAYHFGTHDNLLNDYMKTIYMATHNRAAPYFVGIGFGYYLHTIRNKKITLSRPVVALGWAACMAVLYAVMYGPYELFQYNYKYNVLEASTYSSLHSFAWAIALSWLIFACSKGYGGPINSILSWSLFQPLSKLSYCMFLTHYAVLLVGSSRIRSPIYMDEYLLMNHFTGDAFVTFLASILLYLVFEAPFFVLTRLLFGKDVIKTDGVKAIPVNGTNESVTQVKTDLNENISLQEKMKAASMPEK